MIYTNAFVRNNAVSVFLMGALPAIAGSSISFLLAIFLAWGLISLAFGRFEFTMTRSDRQLAWTFTAFAALVFATGLIAENGSQVFRSTIWLLPFLSLWVVIPRLRASPHIDYLHLYILGAVAGCIGALVLAGIQLAWLDMSRPEGGAGNAAVFANVCLCLAGIAGLAIDTRRRAHRLLAGIAVAAGASAVVLSLTRGVIMLLPLVLILLLVYAPGRWRKIALRPAALAVFAGIGVVLYATREIIGRRIHVTLGEVEQVLAGGHTASMGERVRLWNAAWEAFRDSPVRGYGIQNRMDALMPYLMDDGLPVRSFTHPHNGYLTFAVDGGLIVMAALLALLVMPAVIAWRAPRDGNHRKRLFLVLIVTSAYATIGMTQILFKHDIMDSFYIFTTIVLAASIPDTATAKPEHKEDAPGDGAPAGLASRSGPSG